MFFRNTVRSGVITGLLLQLLQAVFAASIFGFFLVIFWGVTQIVYMLPAILWARSKGYFELAKGLLIAAGVCFLLNALCTGVVFFLLGSGRMRIAG